MNVTAPHPIKGALAVLHRWTQRLEAVPAFWGLLVYAGALRRWFEEITARDDEAYGELMQLEHEVQQGAPAEKLLERIAKVKGLLAALMVALVIGHLAAVQKPDFWAFARRPVTRRELFVWSEA